jgi:sensor c-di-GMP phosphodiesterase-like protein
MLALCAVLCLLAIAEAFTIAYLTREQIGIRRKNQELEATAQRVETQLKLVSEQLRLTSEQLRVVREQQIGVQKLADLSRELEARTSAKQELLRSLQNDEADLRKVILESTSSWVGKAMANATTPATSRAQDLIMRLLRDGKISLDIVIAIQNILLERSKELNGWHKPIPDSEQSTPTSRPAFFRDITGSPGWPPWEYD